MASRYITIAAIISSEYRQAPMHSSSAISPNRRARLRGLITLLRPKQWIKNGFVLAPLLFAGKFGDAAAIGAALIAAALFCVASSATYIINDLHDIERDRAHPKKKLSRPLASGLVTRPQALVLLALLYGVLALAWRVAPAVLTVIGGYLLLNLAYSRVLKHQPVLDIFTIALGFVLRAYAGAVALQVPLSSWMAITTLCLALYLAAVKRRQELLQSGVGGRSVLKKYSLRLIDRYAEMSATGALMFYSLFVLSSRPQLAVTIPLVLFGLFRYWYVVEDLDAGESPTDVLLADAPLLVTLLLWVGACVYLLGQHPA
jgi:decaprenyl-phosphate phosphoribosyltransferase